MAGRQESYGMDSIPLHLSRRITGAIINQDDFEHMQRLCALLHIDPDVQSGRDRSRSDLLHLCRH